MQVSGDTIYRKKKKDIHYEPNAKLRHNFCLKRTQCVLRKAMEISALVGDDVDVLLFLSVRDPLKPMKGMNWVATGSQQSPLQSLKRWKHRLQIDERRKIRQIVHIGPDVNVNLMPDVICSFKRKALIPDPEERGYLAGDDDGKAAAQQLTEEKKTSSIAIQKGMYSEDSFFELEEEEDKSITRYSCPPSEDMPYHIVAQAAYDSSNDSENSSDSKDTPLSEDDFIWKNNASQSDFDEPLHTQTNVVKSENYSTLLLQMLTNINSKK